MASAQNCLVCNCPINRTGSAKYCLPCANNRAKVRIAPKSRRRNQDLSRPRIDGEIVCALCHDPIAKSEYSTRNVVRPRHCPDCAAAHRYGKDVLSGRGTAAVAVQRARVDGLLLPPTAMACADCGNPADCFDHRDYSKPLEVDAVCRSCNVIRGSALPLIPMPLFTGLIRKPSEHSTAHSSRSDRPSIHRER